jgi:diaminohydroxyphosphoribosylaminopyrimidine deaminase/5-amino-6-(5-phosphoribosylamino)uracil reductase
MRRALELAARGQGFVEPNPMVGCVIVQGDQVVGEGWHERFGGPHAEIKAIRAAGEQASGATMYVTLEPCCHHGKTPPCGRAVIEAGLKRVVIAQRDPHAKVDGGGLKELREASLNVELGTLEQEAKRLTAPYLKLIEKGQPWVIAKWAMSLDGKIATNRGDSKWISNEQSRAIVHQLRGRVDAVVVGRGTVEADDPLLTARPPGARTAIRVVLDSNASISLDSQLVQTAREVPLLISAGSDAPAEKVSRLNELGCEVIQHSSKNEFFQLGHILSELGNRQLTNILVEGGATLLGTFVFARHVDEVHVFIAPRIIGGEHAPSAVKGVGFERIMDSLQLEDPQVDQLGGDIYVHGRVSRDSIALQSPE